MRREHSGLGRRAPAQGVCGCSSKCSFPRHLNVFPPASAVVPSTSPTPRNWKLAAMSRILVREYRQRDVSDSLANSSDSSEHKTAKYWRARIPLRVVVMSSALE